MFHSTLRIRTKGRQSMKPATGDSGIAGLGEREEDRSVGSAHAGTGRPSALGVPHQARRSVGHRHEHMEKSGIPPDSNQESNNLWDNRTAVGHLLGFPVSAPNLGSFPAEAFSLIPPASTHLRRWPRCVYQYPFRIRKESSQVIHLC